MIAAWLLAMAVQDAGALTLADVAPADGSNRAMPLAERVLPADIRARVVEGRVRRMWMPGQVFWIGYRERAHAAAPDLCERGGHSLEAKAPGTPGDARPVTTQLTLSKLTSWREVAVLPPGVGADDATCAAATGFIPRGAPPERSLAAYRVLVAAMAAARGKAKLPFRLTCTSDHRGSCADARTALANLPMDTLYGISARCLDAQRYREGSFTRCVPLKPGDSYQAEAEFGMSDPDGQSWRVSFVHRPGWPEVIALRRTMVVYH